MAAILGAIKSGQDRLSRDVSKDLSKNRGDTPTPASPQTPRSVTPARNSVRNLPSSPSTSSVIITSPSYGAPSSDKSTPRSSRHQPQASTNTIIGSRTPTSADGHGEFESFSLCFAYCASAVPLPTHTQCIFTSILVVTEPTSRLHLFVSGFSFKLFSVRSSGRRHLSHSLFLFVSQFRFAFFVLRFAYLRLHLHLLICRLFLLPISPFYLLLSLQILLLPLAHTTLPCPTCHICPSYTPVLHRPISYTSFPSLCSPDRAFFEFLTQTSVFAVFTVHSLPSHSYPPFSHIMTCLDLDKWGVRVHRRAFPGTCHAVQ